MTLDRDLGPDLDDGVELDVALFLAGGDVDLRRRDHVDVLGDDRLDVVLGQRVAQRLVACRLGADARLEQLAGRLAGPESRDLHLLGQLAERGVDGALEVGGGDRDVEADLVAFERFDRRRDETWGCAVYSPASRTSLILPSHSRTASRPSSWRGAPLGSGRDGAAGGRRPLVAGEAGFGVTR